ncbi:hypothetical protein MMC15_000616 [Xylographa vitiligo]|nr:hypothetical protein [Xylographa vitiligo]
MLSREPGSSIVSSDSSEELSIGNGRFFSLPRTDPTLTQPDDLTGQRKSRTPQKKATELRLAAFQGRLRLREKRNELREERSVLAEVDARFVSFIRDAEAQDKQVERLGLEKIYQELLLTRDNYGSLQYEYDQAEDEFEALEAELDEAELLFDEAQESLPGTSDDGIVMRSFAGPAFLSSRASLSSRNGELGEGIIERYQSRVGDANIARERLEDIWYDARVKKIEAVHNEKPRLSRDLIGPTSSISNEGAYHSVQDLKAAYLAAFKDFQNIREDVVNMCNEAREAGLDIVAPVWPWMPSSVLDSDAGIKDSRASSPAPTHQSDSALPSLRQRFGLARARVNKWILERLQGSTIEHTRHKTELQAELQDLQHYSMTDESWARFVLKYWRKDYYGEDISQDAWEFVSYPGSSRRENWTTGAQLDGLVASEVPRAIQDFDLHFSALRKQMARPQKSEFSYSKYRNSPYGAHLDLDTLSEYQSRSFSGWGTPTTFKQQYPASEITISLPARSNLSYAARDHGGQLTDR